MGFSDYTAYGLHFRSEVALPHFGAAEPGEPDVIVRRGAVPQALPQPRRIARRWEAAPGDFLLRVEDRLRYRVNAGREIVVEMLDDAGDELAAAYLMGSACTALLQQRGLLTLHASAICAERGATLFLGKSGAGKSTLAAALALRGFKVLADDVAAVRAASPGPPLVAPGYPNLRLWADSLDLLGLSAENKRRARDGLDKYLLPMERFAAEPQPLRAAYVLGQGSAEALDLNRKTPVEAFRLLRRHTHRHRYVDGLGNERTHFNALADIARNVPVMRIAPPLGRHALDAMAEHIEHQLVV